MTDQNLIDQAAQILSQDWRNMHMQNWCNLHTDDEPLGHQRRLAQALADAGLLADPCICELEEARAVYTAFLRAEHANQAATIKRVREAVDFHEATSDLDCSCGWRGGHGAGSAGQHVTEELRTTLDGGGTR